MESFQRRKSLVVKITEYIKLHVENAKAYSDLLEMKLERETIPDPPDSEGSIAYHDIWKVEAVVYYPEHIKAHNLSRGESDTTKVYAIIWKQCTPVMKDQNQAKQHMMMFVRKMILLDCWNSSAPAHCSMRSERNPPIP